MRRDRRPRCEVEKLVRVEQAPILEHDRVAVEPCTGRPLPPFFSAEATAAATDTFGASPSCLYCSFLLALGFGLVGLAGSLASIPATTP